MAKPVQPPTNGNVGIQVGIQNWYPRSWIPSLDTSSGYQQRQRRGASPKTVSTYLVTRVVTTVETLKANKHGALSLRGFQKSKVGYQWKPSLFGVETPGACSGLPNRRHHLGSKQAGGKQESKHRKRLFPTSTVEGAVLQLPSAVTLLKPHDHKACSLCRCILLQHPVTAETGLCLCNRMARSGSQVRTWCALGTHCEPHYNP